MSAALDQALAAIDRDFGKGSVMRMGDAPVGALNVIPSGSIALDRAMGIMGYPRGRVTEIYGPESSGKSTLCLHAVANCQAQGGTVAYLDTEHSLDMAYAAALGVKPDELIIAQPETAEITLEIADRLIRSGDVSLVVLDSIAAMVPRAELEGSFGDSHVGLMARLMSQALRKITGVLHNTDTALLAVNQVRQSIGPFGGEVQPGGKAMKFYASVRIDVRRIETLKQGDEAVGNRTRAKIVKNKTAPPLKIAEFEIAYGKGIHREAELLELGASAGVQKSGAWFKYGDMQLGQGKAKAAQFLIDNPEVADEIEGKIREGLGEELDG